ncbi:MAG: Error-prone DNA polymerase [Alphaproteobacteria bacterium ADurb.Bin438]|nr:MAG: Error-prone DNA polymerase [Alphaproteobacteria bacterium ADurb.Bin438]
MKNKINERNKMEYVDLHTHTYHSDGYYSPSEVVELANKIGLKAIAMTDHDSVAGLLEGEAKAKELGLEFIKGVEISCLHEPLQKTVHVLGLFIKDVEKLSPVIDKVNALRDEANISDAKQYNELFGLDINADDLKRCRFVHKIIVDKGYASDYPSRRPMKEKVNHKKYGASVKEAIECIHNAGGIAIMAHPSTLFLKDEELFNLIKSFKEMGLDGLECIHVRHDLKKVPFYMDIANKLGLIISGGSDFHGKYKPDESFGKGKGETFLVPYEILENMKKRL